MSSAFPKFLIADNNQSSEDIFVIHTDFPRFIINMMSDEIEWWDDLSRENKDEVTDEINQLIEQAYHFYDTEIESYDD